MSKAYKVLEMTLFANWASYPAFSEVCALEMDSKLTISENGTFLQCWWECKLMQPPQKTVWRFFRKLKKKKKKMLYDPAIPLLGMKVRVKLLSCVQLFATPWTVAYQAPPSMGFSRQKYWSGLPLPSPGDLPDPGIHLGSPAL